MERPHKEQPPQSGNGTYRIEPDEKGHLHFRLSAVPAREQLEQLEREGSHVLRAPGNGKNLILHAPDSLQADSLLAGSLLELTRLARSRGYGIEADDLPDSLKNLLHLALARSLPLEEKEEALPFIQAIGKSTLERIASAQRFIEFLGELTGSLIRLASGKARFRRRDFWVTLQECGADALPIVSLLAFLTGTILAFVGAVQLRKFGATIYMTDLVGLAMAREMGCLMTGIIMSGRTGAAFAAQIGSMNANQEIDALKTFGLSPVEFLVLPRTIALVLMLPVLTMYANVLGWIGGFFVAIPMGINAPEYWNQLSESLTIGHILFGLNKSFFFGIVVATTGCYYGLRSKRNSAAVGQAATRAVVAGITWIVILDAIFALMDEMVQT